ncbi:Conserved_hypothetical protein [Hexamita inflata]|uniref:Uncharacterized protein n=1 Tax=Hexamita inflata TaxID=28002 RepID=A0AA86RB59_9EUKA|nr:Conserved hypothetical protein [Hexamita inflata]
MSTENLSKIGDNIDVDKCFPSKTNKYSFNTGAIVLQNYENHCIAVDMIMKQYKIVEFEPLKHMQSVELRPCGLVNTELLEAVFGKQYIQQVDAEHEKFMENQLKYQVFSQEVNKVLEKCMDQLPEEYRIQVQLQIASTRRCHVHQPEILHNNQLMNVLKLNKFFDVYASISNDHIYLFNQKKEILRKIPVDFHLYPGSTYKNYCYGKECVFYPQLHNVVHCGSHIYLQYYEKVLELTEDLTLKFVATIPNLTINSAEAFYGRLFSMNGKLYAHNYNGSESYSGMLHELQNGVFVEVKETGGSFFQFGDKVFVWNYKEQTLSKLSENLELTRIEVNSKQMEQVQLISWANGVIIMYAKGGAQFVMLNMHTEQIFANQLANPHEYNQSQPISVRKLRKTLQRVRKGKYVRKVSNVHDVRNLIIIYTIFQQSIQINFTVILYRIIVIILIQWINSFNQSFRRLQKRQNVIYYYTCFTTIYYLSTLYFSAMGKTLYIKCLNYSVISLLGIIIFINISNILSEVEIQYIIICIILQNVNPHKINKSVTCLQRLFQREKRQKSLTYVRNETLGGSKYNNKLILKNDKVYNSNDFDRSQILYCTELGQNGFQIQSQIVNDIFGQQSAENIIKAQHNSQFKDILKFASVCFDAQFNNYKHLQLLKERTQMQQQDIQTKINNLVQLNGKLTKLFDQLMLCQQQQ